MKAWLQQHLAALTRAARRIAGSPLNTLLSVLVIGIAMALPAAGYLCLDNLKMLGAHSGGAQQMSLFMRVGASKAMLADIEERLEATLPEQWRFVSRDEALRQMEASEGMAEIIASLPRNPLPDAFILEPDAADPESLETLRATLAQWPGVAHVQLDSAWIRRFDAFLRLGRLAAHLLAVIFAVGLVVVTFNTIRLQVLGQAEEIEVARLIGATDAFIRRPFCYSGVLQGGLGGLAASLLLVVGTLAISPHVSRLATLYGSAFVFHGPSFGHVLALIASGAALGWLGAQLSVRLIRD
jgi:cell division transport system permease protein